MTPDLAGRKQRIDLIKRGIHVARRLGSSLVTFGSGFIRDEHVNTPSTDPRELLVDSIHECLGEIRDTEDITLLIEPEPGMLIETLDQGRALVEDIGSPHFGLHVDICHAHCSEPNCLEALAHVAPMTRYLHISDAREGYNLKIVKYGENLGFNPHFASTLVYFPENADFLLVDGKQPLYFCDKTPDGDQRRRIDMLLARAGVQKSPTCVDYPSLYAGDSPVDDEIFTYLISIPRLSYEVLQRAKPIIGHLRGSKAPPLVERMVANTLTGIVHFHEIPGEGTLDLRASFKALAENGFSGYGSVELYHHVGTWERALTDSYRHLAQFANGN